MNTSEPKRLIVWSKAMDLVVLVYQLTRTFPSEEKFGLIPQMRRSAVSIPSNIAEGARRFSTKEYIRFLSIAYGSASELETQLEIAKRLEYGNFEQLNDANACAIEIMKMLHVMRARLNSTLRPPNSKL